VEFPNSPPVVELVPPKLNPVFYAGAAVGPPKSPPVELVDY